MPDDFKIEGMAEFLRALNTIQKQLPDETEKAGKDIAQDWVSAARNRATRPKAREAAAALSIGFVEGGVRISNSHPAFFGEEFGGRARPETMQFPPHKGQQGYWLFPAARANADKFNRIWEAAIDDATKSWDRRG